MGPAAMTVLCLVEQDAGEAADASLRALTFAARLAGAGPVPVAAVLFGPADQVPGSALAAHGAASAHVVEPGHLDGYAPRAWARALAGLAAQTGATRSWPTSARSPACRWRRTASRRSPPTTAGTGSSGTAGPGCCSKMPP